MPRSLRADELTRETTRRFASAHEVQTNEPPPIQQAGSSKHEELGAVKEGAERMPGMENMKDMPGAAGTPGEAKVYTCVMHPEVRSNKPGKCPKCGMKLVEVKGGFDEGHRH
jgi:hypothetical protein